MVAIAEFAAVVVLLVAFAAEYLHVQRCRRMQGLVFGPKRKPAGWVQAAPFLRVVALSSLTWALITLMQLPPKEHKATGIADEDKKHMLIALDVSPSMRLVDSGPEQDQSRARRAAALLRSFFARVSTEMYQVSILAFYTDAKPVVVDTSDMDVVSNILSDLPMQYAFESGETDLFAGLESAAELAHPWDNDSTTFIMISDGDSVPTTGMPSLPASVADVIIVGVGDTVTGKFIDGRQSRQDASTLRQVAIRLGGTYHNGNEKHLPTDLLKGLAVASQVNPLEQLSKREYALIICGLSGSVYALLPILLYYFGTSWTPGVPHRVAQRKIRLATNPEASLQTVT